MSRVQKATDNETGRTVCLKVQHFEKHAAANRRSSRRPAPPGRRDRLEGHSPPRGADVRVRADAQGRALHRHGVHRRREPPVRPRGEVGQPGARSSSCSPRRPRDWRRSTPRGSSTTTSGPKNFLVNRDQQVKLIDFGLAVPNTPAFRRPGNRTGTIHYMAPELVRREPIDERIDIFSFGVVAFEFLTDRLPYDANPTNSMRLNLEPIDPAAGRPHASRAGLRDAPQADRPQEGRPLAQDGDAAGGVCGRSGVDGKKKTRLTAGDQHPSSPVTTRGWLAWSRTVGRQLEQGLGGDQGADRAFLVAADLEDQVAAGLEQRDGLGDQAGRPCAGRRGRRRGRGAARSRGRPARGSGSRRSGCREGSR